MKYDLDEVVLKSYKFININNESSLTYKHPVNFSKFVYKERNS